MKRFNPDARPPAREIEPGVWQVESRFRAGTVFTITSTFSGLRCDCPSRRYYCWHVQEVEKVLAARRAA